MSKLIVNEEWPLGELIANDPIVCSSPQICCLPENSTNILASNDSYSLGDVPSFLIGLSIGLTGMVVSTGIFCYLTFHPRHAHHAPADPGELHEPRPVVTELGEITIG